MKKRITALFLASVMVFQTGCSATVAMDENGKVTVDGVPIEELAEQFGVLGGDKQEEQADEDGQEVSPEEDETAKKARGGKPWIDSDIKSNISEDLKTDPKEDFHLYANKEWLLDNEIPEGYYDWSHYTERGLEVKKQCMELLKDESIEGHDAKLLRTYNSLILDWDTRGKLGVSEIEDTYKRLLGIESIDDVNDLYIIWRKESQNDGTDNVEGDRLGDDAYQHAYAHTQGIDDQKRLSAPLVRQGLIERRDQIRQVTGHRDKTQSSRSLIVIA